MVVSRSATICEIDTFMTLLSSTITNCADPRITMGSPFPQWSALKVVAVWLRERLHVERFVFVLRDRPTVEQALGLRDLRCRSVGAGAGDRFDVLVELLLAMLGQRPHLASPSPGRSRSGRSARRGTAARSRAGSNRPSPNLTGHGGERRRQTPGSGARTRSPTRRRSASFPARRGTDNRLQSPFGITSIRCI